jgi:UDP-N-acetylglucosamine 4,6-dehydratase
MTGQAKESGRDMSGNGSYKYYPSKLDLDGAAILVTGGTGSFGRAFVRTILDTASPARVIVFSRDEFKQYEMAAALTDAERERLRFFIGDVRDRDRLCMALRGVDYVIHAAALKHVPTAEYNPFECVHTNIIGAENVVNAAIQTGVKRVIALSTDKAASPINLYGASKLASDKIFVAGNHLSGADGCRFAVVRYGNVVGSRGSVLPLFQRLIAEGVNSLPITDDRMTRFWITLPQGVEFVLSCLEIMRGGEIYIPKIPSMKITDLARALAPQLGHHVVGIRPGEKLHEVMITRDDARNSYDLGDRYVIEPAAHMWDPDRARPSSNGGKPLPEDFEYTSDSNDDWLDAERLHRLLDVTAP